ncbi:unnamed protein product [Urochloa humidicola]
MAASALLPLQEEWLGVGDLQGVGAYKRARAVRPEDRILPVAWSLCLVRRLQWHRLRQAGEGGAAGRRRRRGAAAAAPFTMLQLMRMGWGKWKGVEATSHLSSHPLHWPEL